jgi:hypothetical protein
MITSPLHSSLRARTNLVLACVWLAALVCVVFFLGRIPWPLVFLGLVSGMLQGILQRRALRDGATQFLRARSVLEVRAALVSTKAGRAQIWVLWGSFALYLAAVLMVRGQLRTPLDFGPLVLSAILSQWFVRESMTVGACARLERAAIG